MVNHQLCQHIAINQDYLAIYPRSVVQRILRERGSCDENTFPSTLSLQGAGKFLNLRTPHYTIPSLGLNINDIKPQTVLLDDAIYAAIAGPANSLTRILTRATIS